MHPLTAIRAARSPAGLRLGRVLFVLAVCARWTGTVPAGPVALANEPPAPAVGSPASQPAATNPALPVSADYYFTHLTVADGLSDSAMNGVVQDRQGYMWFSTSSGGLNRYDGYEFKVYQHDTMNPRSLSQNNVTALYLDHQGVVWAGTDSGGLNRYDRDTDDFTSFHSKPGDETSLAPGSVRAITEDPSGALWVATDDGLSRLDRTTNKFRQYRHDPSDPGSLSSNAIDSLFCDPETGQLWVGTVTAGVCVLARGATHFTRYQADANVPGSISGNRGLAFCKDRSGTLWIGTDQGLNRFVPESNSFVHYRNDPKDANSLSSDYVWAVHEDSRGRFWVATPKGVNLMDRARGTCVHLPYGTEDPKHLLGLSVQHIAEDDTGAVWFTDVEQGVNRLHSEPPRFTAFRKEIPGVAEGLVNDFVLGVHVDRNDRVWVGSMGGLDFLERGRPPIRHVRFPENLAPMVHTVAEDGQGGYWAGAFPQGMFHLRGDEVTRLPANPDDPTRPASDQIWAFMSDPRRGLWIVYWVVGVDYFDGKTFVRYPPDAANPQRLAGGILLSCATDDKGMIWLAGPSGLWRLDPSTAVFTRFSIDLEHPEHDVNRSPACVYADRRGPGEIWVGTSSGVYQIDKTSGRVTRHYAKRDGLCSDGVQAIERDDQGRLWLGTLDGLSRFDPKRGTFRNYDVADGLPSKKFFNGAAARTSDGRLFFGTTKGLVSFDPSRMPDNPHSPPVVLTGFELFNKPVGIGEEDSPLRKAINVAEEITLTHRQSVFTFKFAALDYAAPEKDRYAYKLEGFDDDWRYTDARRRLATYTRLAPGNYTFRVKAANSDGLWNERGASIRVIILPPWWQTWWFRGSAITALLGMAFTGYRWRVRRIERRNRDLQEQLIERKRSGEVLEQAKEAADAANRAKDQFLAMLSHELRTPLTPVLAIVTGPQSDLPAHMREDMEVIRRNVELETRLIDDLLDLTRLARGKVELHREVVDAHASLRAALEICQAGIHAKRLEVSVSLLADDHHVWADSARLQQVFWNLINNAAKFTPEQGTIRVSSRNSNGRLQIQVSDTGIGIEPEMLPRIFDAFEQAEQTRARRFGGLGLGLTIAKRVMDLHHGQLTASSEGHNRGCTFTVELAVVAPPVSMTAAPRPVSAGGDGKAQRILLVDDNRDTLKIVCRLLRGRGYKVTTAESVKTAMEAAAREQFDLLISDIGLPDGSGLEIMRRVKQMCGLRGIAVSGYGMEEDVGQSRAAGFEQHLTKPVDAAQLLAAIARCLDRADRAPRCGVSTP